MSKTRSRRHDIESRIREAVKKASSQRKSNVSALAREFGIPRSTLRDRVKGRPAKTAFEPPNRLLSKPQEEALLNWIRHRDALHNPPTPKAIEACVNRILERNATSQPSPHASKMWVYRFLKRLPSDLKLVKQKPIERKTLSTMDIEKLREWFDELKTSMADIPPKNIYNFDETGFQLGEGKAQNVVTSNPERAGQGVAVDGTNDSLTGIECVSADGTVIPPYFIFKGEYNLERWYLQVPESAYDYRIATAPKEYTTDEIALDWLLHFHEHTKERARKSKKSSKLSPRLLLMDGHGSHLTYEFLDFCQKHNIIPFCFVPRRPISCSLWMRSHSWCTRTTFDETTMGIVGGVSRPRTRPTF